MSRFSATANVSDLLLEPEDEGEAEAIPLPKDNVFAAKITAERSPYSQRSAHKIPMGHHDHQANHDNNSTDTAKRTIATQAFPPRTTLRRTSEELRNTINLYAQGVDPSPPALPPTDNSTMSAISPPPSPPHDPPDEQMDTSPPDDRQHRSLDPSVSSSHSLSASIYHKLTQGHQLLPSANAASITSQSVNSHMNKTNATVLSTTTSSIARHKQRSHSASLSEQAIRRKYEKEITNQLEALTSQLQREQRLSQEHNQARKKLSTAYENKCREAKLYEMKCQELQRELLAIQSHLHGDSLSELQQQHQEVVTKNHILEAALAFRSEEIGLSGHADLLCQIAALRGQINALRQELLQKNESLSTITQEYEHVKVSKDELQSQIAAIQSRLSASQQELYKYQKQDIIALLQQTEAERDLLLSYIQSDLEKSSTFAKQIEQLEQELRLAKKQSQFVQEQWQQSQQEVHNLREKSQVMTEELRLAQMQARERQQTYDRQHQEFESLSRRCDQQQQDIEEMIAAQSKLLAQLRVKDEELLRKSQDLLSLRATQHALEAAHEQLTTNYQQSHEQALQDQQELRRVQQRLAIVEPKFRVLEPQYEELQSRFVELQKQLKEILEEQQRLQVWKTLFDELVRECQEMRSVQWPAGHPLTKANDLPLKKHVTIPLSTILSTTNDNKATKVHGHAEKDPVAMPSGRVDSSTNASLRETRSQWHSVWISLPSLRKLLPDLFELVKDLNQEWTTVARPLASKQRS